MLEILRFQMRLAKDLQCMTVTSYGFATKNIEEIGKLVGGWIKSVGNKTWKRHGNLWADAISFPNLLRAAQQAGKGKRFRAATATFHFNLERELWRLHEELANETYRPGPYRTFTIREPKARQISAAPYRDRVVHHVLVNVLAPIFERCFIRDSYACRKGKGTHAAVSRCQEFSRRFRYVLKADVRKFFPSMDHEILKESIARKIKDRSILGLVVLIIDNIKPQEYVSQFKPGDDLFTRSVRRQGIPIGNLTNQFFANVYLDPLDHFLKERLGTAGYVRYVDDFLVFAECKRQLGDVREAIREFLVTLRLLPHPTKNTILRVDRGVRFLGFRVFPTHRLLPKENVRRFRRRVCDMQAEYAAGEVRYADIHARLMSWNGHAQQADTFRLRQRLFATMRFQRAATD